MHIWLYMLRCTALCSVSNRDQDRLRMHKSLMKRQELLFSRTLIGCLKLQVVFHKRATNYSALLRKMTHEHETSFVSHTQVKVPSFCWTKPLKIQQKKSLWRFKCGLTILGRKGDFHSSAYMYVYNCAEMCIYTFVWYMYLQVYWSADTELCCPLFCRVTGPRKVTPALLCTCIDI